MELQADLLHQEIWYASIKLMLRIGMLFRYVHVAQLFAANGKASSEGFFHESEVFFRRWGTLHPKSTGCVHVH